MTRQGAEPGLDRIHRLRNAGKIAALDDLLGQPELFGGDASIFVPDVYSRGDIGLTDLIRSQLLQG